MTTPIVERLRDTAQHCSSWGIDLDIPPYAQWADLMDEAANVIDGLMEEVADLEAAVERLRLVINEEVRKP